MQVISSIKHKLNHTDYKVSQATATNSQTNSTGNSQANSKTNSTLFLLSKDDSHLTFQPEQLVIKRQKNKKCINLTVIKIKPTLGSIVKAKNQQRISSLFPFQFCQQTSINKQNFYTQLIDEKNIQQTLYPELAFQKQVSQQKMDQKGRSSTLSCPKSPINKLIKLIGQDENEGRDKKKILFYKH